MAELSDFILSKVRVKLLQLFFEDPSEMWYVREITRKVDEEINAVRRELDRMTTAGMLHTEDRGNRKYYNLNHQYDFYPELMRLVAKTAGLGQQMKHNRKKLGTIKYVMFTGKFSKHEQHKHDEVKILREDEARTSEERRLRHSPELWRGDDLLCTYEVIERELIE
jgi:predicted transcriptional regulator